MSYMDVINLPGFPEEARERIKIKDKEVNEMLLEVYKEAYYANPFPCVGDWVYMMDDVKLRIAHVWREYYLREGGDEEVSADWFTNMDYHTWSIQTAIPTVAPHLGKGYMSFSGSLNCSVPCRGMFLTDDLIDAPVWIWNRGIAGAGRGYYTRIPCRVWISPEVSPSA